MDEALHFLSNDMWNNTHYNFGIFGSSNGGNSGVNLGAESTTEEEYVSGNPSIVLIQSQ